jgi:hypothetical protein
MASKASTDIAGLPASRQWYWRAEEITQGAGMNV